jgi:hypothetical protein
METGLQAGFGDALANLRVLETLGIQWARVDITEAVNYPAVVGAFQTSTVKPLFLIRDVSKAAQLIDSIFNFLDSSKTAIEIFNEPNYNGISPKVWFDGIMAVYKDARLRNYKGDIIAGAIGNLNKSGLDFWEAVKVNKLPLDVVLGFHRYQPGTQIGWNGQTRREVPWDGFNSRTDELNYVHKVAGIRDIALTEFGYHTAPEYIWWHKVQMSNEQARDCLAADFRLFNQNNVKIAVVYQWSDGLTEDYMSHFGITDTNANLKPQSEAFKLWQS